MNREALFCDGTGDYVCPAEPEINEKENTIMLCNDRKRTVWTEKEDIDRNPDRKDEAETR